MKKIAGGSGAQKTFMLSFHCKAVELDTDAFTWRDEGKPLAAL